MRIRVAKVTLIQASSGRARARAREHDRANDNSAMQVAPGEFNALRCDCIGDFFAGAYPTAVRGYISLKIAHLNNLLFNILIRYYSNNIACDHIYIIE